MNRKYITKEINTKNLILKKGCSEDCAKVYEYDMLKCRGIAGEDVTVKSNKKVDFIGPDTDHYYNYICVKEKMFDWYVYLKKTNEPIANIVADREIKEINSIELSFNMHPDYWRKGYMTESVIAVINYLFSLGYDNIIMGYDDGNIKSESFIKKLGFSFYKRLENVYQKNGQNIGTTLMIMSKDNWNIINQII